MKHSKKKKISPLRKGTTTVGRENTINRLALSGYLASHRTTVSTTFMLPHQTANPKLHFTIEQFHKLTLCEDAYLLDVSHCKLDPQDFVILKAVVSCHPTLSVLNLRGNHVDNIAAQFLLTMCTENVHLTEVHFEHTNLTSSVASKIEEQLARNRAIGEAKRTKAEAKHVKALRKVEDQKHRAETEALVDSEKACRRQILLEVGEARDAMGRAKISDQHRVRLDFRRERLRNSHRAQREECALEESEYRQEFWRMVELEMLYLCQLQYETQRRIFTDLQNGVRADLKKELKHSWVLSRRAEKLRLLQEHDARVNVVHEAMTARKAVEDEEALALPVLLAEVEVSEKATRDREEKRKEREEHIRTQKIRSEEAAKERKEREDLLRFRTMQQLLAEQARVIQAFEADQTSTRALLKQEEDILFRLAYAAYRMVLEFWRSREAMVLQDNLRKKEVTCLWAGVNVDGTPKRPLKYFHTNFEGTRLLSDVKVILMIDPESYTRIETLDCNLRQAHRNTINLQSRLIDELAKLKTEKILEKLDPKMESFKSKVAAQKAAMVEHAESALNAPIEVDDVLPQTIKVEKERIWGGHIRVKLLRSDEFDGSLEEHGRLFVRTKWKICPANVEPNPTEPVSERPISLSRKASLRSPGGSFRFAAKRRSPPHSPRIVPGTLPAEDTESLEDIVDLEGADIPRFTEFEIEIPPDGSATQEEIQEVLRSIAYRSTIPSLKETGPFEQKVEVKIEIKVGNLENFNLLPRQNTLPNPTQFTSLQQNITVSVIVCNTYVWIPMDARQSVYQEQSLPDDSRIFNRVKVNDPPLVISQAGGEVYVAPGGGSHTTFENGAIVLTFLSGYTNEDQILFRSTPNCMWLLGDVVWIRVGTEDYEVARVTKGSLLHSSTPLQSVNASWRNAEIELTIVSRKCGGDCVRRIISRLRFGNVSKDPDAGFRQIQVAVRDGEGNVCKASTWIELVTDDAPPELFLTDENICYRNSGDILDDKRKYLKCPLLYMRIAPRAKVHDEDTDRFLGGHGSVCVYAPLSTDRIVLLCKLGPPVTPSDPPSPVPLQSLTDSGLFPIYNTLEGPALGGQRRPNNASSTRSQEEAEEEASVKENDIAPPRINIHEGVIYFEGRTVGKITEGGYTDGTILPEQVPEAGSKVSWEFDMLGGASVTASQEILRCVAYAVVKSEAKRLQSPTNSPRGAPQSPNSQLRKRFSIVPKRSFFENKRTIQISMQLGNTVPRPRVDGSIKLCKYDPSGWAENMSGEVEVTITPQLFWNGDPSGSFEYRQGSEVKGLAAFEFQEDTLLSIPFPPGSYIRVEIVEGSCKDDVLGIKVSDEVQLKKQTQKNQSRQRANAAGPGAGPMKGKLVVLRSLLSLSASSKKMAGDGIVKDMFLLGNDGKSPDGSVHYIEGNLMIFFNHPVTRKHVLSVLKHLTFSNTNKTTPCVCKIVRVIYYEEMGGGNQVILEIPITEAK